MLIYDKNTNLTNRFKTIYIKDKKGAEINQPPF